MKDVETRRSVPAARTALITVCALGIFQILMLAGAYEIDASSVRRGAPWLYNTFRKMVGEDPSTRPDVQDGGQQSSRETTIETVTGIKPEELDVKLNAEPVEVEMPAEQPRVIIPVSKPKQADPLDSDEPVG